MPSIKEADSGLTADHLRTILSYNRNTGIFIWRISPAQRVSIGDIAGGWDGDYWAIWIDSKKHLAHRLAWLYVYGIWPERDLDHQDTVKSHNWIDNLRQSTRSQNIANTRRRRNNTSGFKGVSANGTGWMARIRKYDQLIYLGTYETPEEAHAVYVAKSLELFGEFANAGL